LKHKDLNNFPFDIHIAAIKSALPSYKLAWQINQAFFMDFEMSVEWEKTNQQGQMGYFTHFFYRFEDVELNWHLIDNRGANAYFLQTKPMFDFYLICVGEDIYDYFSKAIEAIQDSQKIENVFRFSPSHIKNIDVIYQNITKTKEFIKDLHV
jgi:hypothetical protein